MQVRVYAAGKLKDDGLERLCATYIKRVRPFLPVEVVELRSQVAVCKRLHDRADGAIRVLLDERGEQLTTRAWADSLHDARARGARGLALFIGDATGFSDADRSAADHLLALSRMTLPHRLARLILLEQLYRAASLIAGHPYHHE
ncbi:MAG: 23S rRNA (pseudouridine(1915)-N(3))-methyltransferase RlmH [Myxococcales bacterium]|nr:23S rRNA (pseudouridine(1915)-N(3))-methyltransferase RlmH [Myxococcales bacterium]